MVYEYKLYSYKSLFKNCASLVFNVVAEGGADQLITLLESQVGRGQFVCFRVQVTLG